MGSTQSNSHHEQGLADRAVPGVVILFSGNAALLRPVALGPEGLTVGRENSFGPINDERMSRQHAQFRFDGAQWAVIDTSKNGTSVNGAKVEGRVKASSGSIVKMGATLLMLVDDVRRFQAAEVSVADDGLVVGPTLRAALDRITLAARNGQSVLIGGESGAGKELAAKTFHRAVAPDGPFVSVNCATIQQSIAERLLFGAVKGAYTEAKADTEGFVQAAHGGVLFLDELGELNLEVQAKLLRVVETHEVFQLGATAGKKVKVRYVGATHKDLRRAVAEKTFRQDLYYRFQQAEVELPSLKERREEIAFHVTSGLAELEVRTAHVSLVEACLLRPWPGNVRELRAAVRQAAVNANAAQSLLVRAEHLNPDAGLMPGTEAPEVAMLTTGTFAAVRTPSEPHRISQAAPGSTAPPVAAPPAPPAAPVKELSREDLVAALAAENGNKSAAQRRLNIAHRTTFIRLLERHGLNQNDAE